MIPDKGLILYATDFSAGSSAAFELACTLARDRRATLAIVHVLTPPIVPFGRSSCVIRKKAARRMRQLPVPPDIDVERWIVRGDPATVILEAASAHQAAVIVLGRGPHYGLQRFINNRVSEQ